MLNGEVVCHSTLNCFASLASLFIEKKLRAAAEYNKGSSSGEITPVLIFIFFSLNLFFNFLQKLCFHVSQEQIACGVQKRRH